MMADAKQLISIVIPVYNEQKNIRPLYEVLREIIASVSGKYDFEIIFTDNCSVDNSFEILRDLHRQDRRVRVYRFSRNFGYQRSIFTGYMKARGDAAIQLDCDFQDPPEMILKFLEKWEQGYQVVYGVRRSRKEAWWMHFSRRVFYRLIDFLSETPLPKDVGDFRLIDKCIIKQIQKSYDSQPYLRGMISEFGFRQTGIEYDRRERRDGVTKFSMGELFNLAIDGILNHSIVPLRIATFMGLFVSLSTFIGTIIYITGKLFLGKAWPAGFATTTVLILFGISLNALFLGVIGEYLGRIYRQVKRPPITIIDTELSEGG